jgi:hypothetical protein
LLWTCSKPFPFKKMAQYSNMKLLEMEDWSIRCRNNWKIENLQIQMMKFSGILRLMSNLPG